VFFGDVIKMDILAHVLKTLENFYAYKLRTIFARIKIVTLRLNVFAPYYKKLTIIFFPALIFSEK